MHIGYPVNQNTGRFWFFLVNTELEYIDEYIFVCTMPNGLQYLRINLKDAEIRGFCSMLCCLNNAVPRYG